LHAVGVVVEGECPPARPPRRACATLVSASWAVRKTASAASEGSRRGSPLISRRALDPMRADFLDQGLRSCPGRGPSRRARGLDRGARLVQPPPPRGGGRGPIAAITSESTSRSRASSRAPLELDRERRERVGEHVVELAGDPAALVEGCRLVARQSRPLLLLEQFARLDLALLAQPQQVGRSRT